MSNMRPLGAPLTFLGREYHLLFTCNVIDKFVDRFDTDINNIKSVILDSPKRYGNCAEVLTYLINEAAEIENEGKESDFCPTYSVEYVKRHVNNMNFAEIFGAIVDAYTLSFLKNDKDDDDIEADPNLKGGSE